MSYKKTHWVDGETRLNADELNRIEDAIAELDDAVKNGGGSGSVYSVLASVDCSHNREITGVTGNEKGLVIGNQKMNVTKVQGQTWVINQLLDPSKMNDMSDYGVTVDRETGTVTIPAQDFEESFSCIFAIFYEGAVKVNYDHTYLLYGNTSNGLGYIGCGYGMPIHATEVNTRGVAFKPNQSEELDDM